MVNKVMQYAKADPSLLNLTIEIQTRIQGALTSVAWLLMICGDRVYAVRTLFLTWGMGSPGARGISLGSFPVSSYKDKGKFPC